MAKKKDNKIGGWAFLIGVILALVLGLLGPVTNETIVWILVVIGVVVGLLNIADKEAMPFLLSGAVLIIAAALGQGVLQGVPILSQVVDALLLIFVPATVVVAIRNVLSLASR
tara:strand:- start:3395 stop:3733 length:339 start_codon:yes stop_codon:yes gene_type:complete